MNIVRLDGVHKATIDELKNVYKVSLLTVVNNVKGAKNYNEKLPTHGAVFEIESPLLSQYLLLDFCSEVETAIIQLKQKFEAIKQ